MEHEKLVKEMEKHEAELMKTISSNEKSNVEFKKEGRENRNSIIIQHKEREKIERIRKSYKSRDL